MRITHLTRECPVQYDQGFPGTMHILHILQVCCTHQKSTGTLPSPCFLLFLCLWKVLNDVYQPIAYLWLSCMYLSAYRVHIGCHALISLSRIFSCHVCTYQPIVCILAVMHLSAYRVHIGCHVCAYQPIAYLWLSCAYKPIVCILAVMHLSAYRVHMGCHALSAHHSLISLSFACQPITTSTLWTLPSPNMGSTFPMNSLPSTVSDLTPLLTWFGLEMLMSYTAPLKYLLTL